MRKRLREGTLNDRRSRSIWPKRGLRWRSWARKAWKRWPSSSRACSRRLGQGKRKTRKLKIGEALKLLVDEEAAKLVNDEEIKSAALANAEDNGIVFIDEIDKVASRSEQAAAPRCRARACSATCCRWWRARP
jgi:ATP-dependent HslUV protease ATP-binding subunit HslU